MNVHVLGADYSHHSLGDDGDDGDDGTDSLSDDLSAGASFIGAIGAAINPPRTTVVQAAPAPAHASAPVGATVKTAIPTVYLVGGGLLLVGILVYALKK